MYLKPRSLTQDLSGHSFKQFTYTTSPRKSSLINRVKVKGGIGEPLKGKLLQKESKITAAQVMTLHLCVSEAGSAVLRSESMAEIVSVVPSHGTQL